MMKVRRLTLESASRRRLIFDRIRDHIPQFLRTINIQLGDQVIGRVIDRVVDPIVDLRFRSAVECVGANLRFRDEQYRASHDTQCEAYV